MIPSIRFAIVIAAVSVSSVAVAGSTYVARAQGMGTDSSRDNACSSATTAANAQVSFVCAGGTVQGSQDQGCNCTCNPMGDSQVCSCTDIINVTCERFGK